MARMRRIRVASLVLLVAASLSACSEGDGTSGDGAPVDRADIEEDGGEWPLTVESGRVGCEDGRGLTFKTTDGDVYALNGLAAGQGFADIDPIWAADPDYADIKVGIGDLIEWGNTICGH